MWIRPMDMKWQSTIIKKTLDERVVVCHKLVNDRGALTMMCRRDEEPWPSVVACWRIVMTHTCYRAMDMHYW